jgi:NTP pyrophosphatase (non-canonical NTP hydrolase)
MIELINKCSKWSEDRNLIKGSTSKDQVLKLIQEVGELSDNVCKGKDVTDDVGDCLVVLNNIALQNDTTLLECLKIAYNDIKDRKGEMRDGIFIKESDL